MCLGAVAIAVAVERSRRSPILGMAIAVAAGSALGLLALLAAAGGEWTYYPQKFAWLAAITPIVLIAGLTLPAVERILKGRGFRSRSWR